MCSVYMNDSRLLTYTNILGRAIVHPVMDIGSFKGVGQRLVIRWRWGSLLWRQDKEVMSNQNEQNLEVYFTLLCHTWGNTHRRKRDV